MKPCEICGTAFRPRTNLLKIGGSRFCSNKCYGQHLSKTKSGQNSSHWIPRMAKICAICSKVFLVEKRLFDKQKTCSKTCRAIYGSRHNKYANSSIERKIKKFLIDKKIPFRFQARIGGATPDFLIDGCVCIFADGDYWHHYPHGTERDKSQNDYLLSHGHTVLRFWERDINNKFDVVADKIMKTVGCYAVKG
jgi:very-short-patch-repair endonuclease